MYNEVTAMILGAEEQVDQLDGLKPRRSDGHVFGHYFLFTPFVRILGVN